SRKTQGESEINVTPDACVVKNEYLEMTSPLNIGQPLSKISSGFNVSSTWNVSKEGSSDQSMYLRFLDLLLGSHCASTPSKSKQIWIRPLLASRHTMPADSPSWSISSISKSSSSPDIN